VSTLRRRRVERADLYQSPQFTDAATRIAVNVRRLRTERDWTQEATAEACGLDIRVVQAVESGAANTTLVTLSRLAEGLRVDIAVFLAPVAIPLLKRRGRPPKQTDPTATS